MISVFIFLDKFQEVQLKKMREQQIINMSLVPQQNSFYPVSYISDVMITWHLRKVVPRPEILLFTRKKHQ
jgi:hypothetical protein